MLSVIYAECHKLALHSKFHYVECHYAECHYVECRGAEVSSLIYKSMGVNLVR
jgi:hypothetical protein